MRTTDTSQASPTPLASSLLPPGVDLCRWVDSAACGSRPELPWVSDAAAVSEDERAAMAAVCARCPVLASCEAAADLLDACAAYWAGHHRDETADEAVQWLPHAARGNAPAAGAVVGWEQSALAWPCLDGVA